jgi:hypothetical protein
MIIFKSNRTMRSFRRACVLGECMIAIFGLVLTQSGSVDARPVPKSIKGGGKGVDAPQNFLRQTNTFSNVEFYYTNRGVIFNSGGLGEGLFWPRGSGQNYIFGSGLWFATQKVVGGKRKKLCDIGYNPNSGAGWYVEGEDSDVGLSVDRDGSNPAAKYISYVGPRYDKTNGSFNHTSTVVPSPYYRWPLWDTSSSKTIKHNFYFGDYISNVNQRDKLVGTTVNGHPVTPSILSEEDIFNQYSDEDVANDPEFRPGAGYPFGINIQEAIYSWSFGRYRDMIFVRHKVTNASGDSLLNCWMAPAFDADLGAGAANESNSFVSDSVGLANNAAVNAGLREPYRSHPSKLNMGYYLSHAQEHQGKEYGMVGFSFLESPVIDPANGNIIANDDSTALGGYGPNSRFQQDQLGLVTFKKWTINNDPSTGDLRYDFVSSRSKDLTEGLYGDMRHLMGTGPFTLPPGKSVETVVAITFAHPSTTNQEQNFEALLSLTDFAHQVFGEPDSIMLPDSTTGWVLNHFLSPVPPDIPNLKTQALNKAVLVTWDNTAERSDDPVTGSSALPFLGYQLWRTTRSDHDSTIRPDGANPNILLGQWQLYDFRTDSNFNSQEHFIGFHYTRLNKTPHPIPHSYLDVGDDDHNGILTGNEGLLNGEKYYYYLIAYDEYDSVNKIGPLYTALVPPKNFVSEIPARPVYLTTFNADTTSDLDSCYSGGVQDVRLDVVDTGRFAQLFANDTIIVKFQPRWIEDNDQFLDLSHLLEWVDVTDTKNGLNNTYASLHNPSGTPSTEAYFFPTTLPGAILLHVDGTVTQPGQDSTFLSQFTTDNSSFAPNQLVDQSFRVLADVQFDQLNTPYRLKSVTVSGSGDPGILRLSRRTNNGAIDQNILNLDPNNGTRPSFLGALGETTYEITFDNPVPAPVAIVDSSTQTTFTPQVLPIHVRLANCSTSELRHIQDSATDLTEEFDWRYYSHLGVTSIGTNAPFFDDPDTMKVPNPGWYEMNAYHFVDQGVAIADMHTNAQFDNVTTGPYYWPINDPGNSVNGESHLVDHRLSVAGAELLFDAPGLGSIAISYDGDSLPTTNPHMNDFAPGDKIDLAFGGITKNLPFPGSAFRIYTKSGPPVDFANSNLYKGAVLDQVQVVPNPYIVTHLGQTATDNALLYFTRLPPRATIEIYAIDGTLVQTIEHYGYASSTTQSPNDPTQTVTNYNFNQLSDRSSVETWNLLTSGKQRVGSQVLVARVIARDPNNHDAEIGETTTKFAVIVGTTNVNVPGK